MAGFGNREPIVDAGMYPAPLTLGVISDTHIYPGSRRSLSPEFGALFRRFGCGLILHAGDCCTQEVVDELSEIAPTLVVVGNNDLGVLEERAPHYLTFRVGSKSVALLHGHGGVSARAEAKLRFAGKADLVVYGHSHIPKIELVEDSILFNPGSATDRRWYEHFGIGVITISDEKVEPDLILFNDPRELANVKP